MCAADSGYGSMISNGNSSRVNRAFHPRRKSTRILRPSSFGLNQTNTEKGLDHGVFTVLTTERTRPGRFDSVLSGEISVDGRKEIVTAPAVTFEIVRGFQIHVPTEVNVRLGASTQLAGRVQREPEFFSPVTIRGRQSAASRILSNGRSSWRCRTVSANLSGRGDG